MYCGFLSPCHRWHIPRSKPCAPNLPPRNTPSISKAAEIWGNPRNRELAKCSSEALRDLPIWARCTVDWRSTRGLRPINKNLWAFTPGPHSPNCFRLRLAACRWVYTQFSARCTLNSVFHISASALCLPRAISRRATDCELRGPQMRSFDPLMVATPGVAIGGLSLAGEFGRRTG